MGNYGSTLPPDITVTQPGAEGWDHWGYAPMGAKTSQKNYSLSYTDTPAGWGTTEQRNGLANSPLAMLGTDAGGLQVPSQNTWSWAWWVTDGGVVDRAVPLTAKNNFKPKVDWYDSNYCTPDNFPNCDMTELAISMPQYKLWNGVIAKYDSHTGWSKAIESQVHKYATDGLAYADALNSGDTTDYIDPCEGPSSLDRMLPIALGALSYVLVQRFLGPELTLIGLSDNAMLGINVNTFLIGYYIGRQAVVPFGDDEPDGYNAGLALANGVGFPIGCMITLQYPEYAPYEVLGGLAGAWLCRNTIGIPIAILLDSVIWAATAPARYILGIWRVITQFFCKWVAGMRTACDDYEDFPDARRWDVSELSAKIVDELCEEEGWQRDSPQARFAFMAMIETPAWQFAAAKPNVKIEKSNYDRYAINPMGQIAPVVWGSQYVGAPETWGYWNPLDAITPDGTSYADVVNSANNDAIMCQNYDILRAGTGDSKGDPELPLRFAKTMARWKESVRESAKVARNWNGAHMIGGMPSQMPNWMTPQEYLNVCRFDADNGGFDTYLQRGQYAMIYTPQVLKQHDANPEQIMLIEINQYMDMCLSVDDFYDTLVQAGIVQNLCGAIAYALIEPQGAQQVDWVMWQRTEEPGVRACNANAKLTPPLAGHAFQHLGGRFENVDYPLLPTVPTEPAKPTPPTKPPVWKPIKVNPADPQKPIPVQQPQKPIGTNPGKFTYPNPPDCYQWVFDQFALYNGLTTMVDFVHHYPFPEGTACGSLPIPEVCKTLCGDIYSWLPAVINGWGLLNEFQPQLSLLTIDAAFHYFQDSHYFTGPGAQFYVNMLNGFLTIRPPKGNTMRPAWDAFNASASHEMYQVLGKFRNVFA